MGKLATKGIAIDCALLVTDPNPMQLSLKAVPQKHSSVFTNIADVLGVFSSKKLLLHALFEGAVTAVRTQLEDMRISFDAHCYGNLHVQLRPDSCVTPYRLPCKQQPATLVVMTPLYHHSWAVDL